MRHGLSMSREDRMLGEAADRRHLRGGDGLALDRLLEELRYPEAVEQAVRRKLADPGIGEIAASAYAGEDLDIALCRRMPLTRLAAVTFLLLQSYGDYREKGAPDRIIFDTFRDVSLRAGLYHGRTGKVGISRGDVVWFRHIMSAGIFKIGALQYQPFKMVYLDEETIGEPYMVFSPEQKASLPSGVPVINCHIQRGADFDPERVDRSLRDARAFFQTAFPERRFQAFLCYSWLLYPKMVERLPSRSNIRRFADRFTVISSCDDAEQAMENLFEGGKRGTIPSMTSLQRLAVDHSEYFGFACGIAKMGWTS